MSYITEEQAAECFAIVERYLGPACNPMLYRDHEGPFWNISYEGYGEWAYDIIGAVDWPEGVFAEPVASWCLGLHPAG